MEDKEVLELVSSDNHISNFYLYYNEVEKKHLQRNWLINFREVSPDVFVSTNPILSSNIWESMSGSDITKWRKPVIPSSMNNLSKAIRFFELRSIAKILLEYEHDYVKKGLACNLGLKKITKIHQSLLKKRLVDCTITEFSMVFNKIIDIDIEPRIKWYGTKDELAYFIGILLRIKSHYKQIDSSKFTFQSNYSKVIFENEIFIIQKRVGKKTIENEWKLVKNLSKKVKGLDHKHDIFVESKKGGNFNNIFNTFNSILPIINNL